LTVDWVRWTRSPAFVKPPASTTDTKLRRSSISIIGLHPFIEPLIYILSFNFQMYRPRHKCCGAKGNSHARRTACPYRTPISFLDAPASRPGHDVLPDVGFGFFRRQDGHRRLPAAALPCGALPRRRRADDGSCRRERRALDIVEARRAGFVALGVCQPAMYFGDR